MAFKPLIDLRPTTIRKAFLVNGIVAATIAAFTVEFRRALDYTEETKGLTRPQKLGMTTVAAFAIAMITYLVSRALLGFGGGMLSSGKTLRFF